MADKPRSYTQSDSYFKLVRAFPLTRIRNDDHLAAAQEVIDGLLRRELDYGEQEYLDALTDHVERYENESVHIPDASEADVLRALMAANQLSQATLAKAVGISQSTISAVLNGDRSLSEQHIAKIAAFFHMPSSIFLPV